MSSTSNLPARITRDEIGAAALAGSLAGEADGAIVTFDGIVRRLSRGKRIRFLEYDVFPEMAEKQLNADDEVAGRNLAIRGRAFHRPQQLMAEDKAPLAGRRGAVGPHEDFTVGRANPERARAHQNRSVRERRFGHIVEPGGIGDSGQNRDCAHPVLSVDGLDFSAGGGGMRYSAG